MRREKLRNIHHPFRYEIKICAEARDSQSGSGIRSLFALIFCSPFHLRDDSRRSERILFSPHGKYYFIWQNIKSKVYTLRSRLALSLCTSVHSLCATAAPHSLFICESTHNLVYLFIISFLCQSFYSFSFRLLIRFVRLFVSFGCECAGFGRALAMLATVYRPHIVWMEEIHRRERRTLWII